MTSCSEMLRTRGQKSTSSCFLKKLASTTPGNTVPALAQANSISYANCAAQFTSVYGQGPSDPEAAWANRKYHGYQTLPLDMATKLKTEHENKYGMQNNNV